ncbi:MAG: VCBS repeat-containing protein [bacterium]|nr:VCBS repeat-containing protein [bacterium]
MPHKHSLWRTGVSFTVVGLACLFLAHTACGADAGGLKFSRRCLMVSPNEGCAIADVNRDGKPDIIAGTSWFAAPDFIPRPVRELQQVSLGFGANEFYANNGDHLCDVDGDGWIDVISGGWTEAELFWYKNPGKDGLEKGWKWEPRLLVKARAENEAFDLRDLDGDGVPEVIVHCWVGRDPMVIWKLARGADGQPTANRIVLGANGCGHGYSYGDVNGDGRDDILCAAGWYECPSGDVFAKPWKFHPETSLSSASSPFVVVDVNGDGRNDIIWGKGHDYGVYLREQGEPKPDGTTTWTEHLIDKEWSQAHSMAWADLDGDGKGELITGKRVRGHGDYDPGAKEPECLYYYKWDGAAQKFVRHTISPPGRGPGTGMQICVADLNGDGRPDIAVSGKSGTWLLINEGMQD